jgi:hypothetical protein
MGWIVASAHAVNGNRGKRRMSVKVAGGDPDGWKFSLADSFIALLRRAESGPGETLRNVKISFKFNTGKRTDRAIEN